MWYSNSLKWLLGIFDLHEIVNGCLGVFTSIKKLWANVNGLSSWLRSKDRGKAGDLNNIWRSTMGSLCKDLISKRGVDTA